MPARTFTPTLALTVALCAAAALVVAPLWAPLVLAAWFADLLRPGVRRLEHLLGGRRRGAAAVVVLLTIGALLPLGGIVLALVSGTQDLLQQLRAAFEGQGSLAGALLGGTTGTHPEVRDWADLASRYGANAWRAVSMIARASATAAVGIFVFVAALYAFAADGDAAYAWLESARPDASRIVRAPGRARSGRPVEG